MSGREGKSRIPIVVSTFSLSRFHSDTYIVNAFDLSPSIVMHDHFFFSLSLAEVLSSLWCDGAQHHHGVTVHSHPTVLQVSDYDCHVLTLVPFFMSLFWFGQGVSWGGHSMFCISMCLAWYGSQSEAAVYRCL